MMPCLQESIHTLNGAAFIEIVRAVLDRGALFRFQASGHSMRPFIKNGDIVVLAPISQESSPCPGDVVLYQNPQNGNPLLHRIVGRKGIHFIVRGDSLPESDGIIAREQILARAVSVERNGRATSMGLGPGRRILAVLVGTGAFFLMKRCAVFLRRSFFRGKHPI